MGRLREWYIDFKYRLGLMSREEVVHELLPEREKFINDLPKEAQPDVRAIIAKTDSLSTVMDVGAFFEKTHELQDAMRKVLDKYGDELLPEVREKVGYVAGVDTMGYRPSGAHAWRFFINPFAVFTFYCEQHWACKAAIDIILTEVLHDGFSLVHDKSVSKQRVDYVKNALKKLQVGKLRLNVLRHYLAYGNVLVRTHRNPFQQFKKFEILVMDRVMPQFDKRMENVIGWDLWTGYHSELIPIDKIHHLGAPSFKHPDLGLPPLSPVIVDIESDMSASALNNQVMKKAGMIGVIICTKTDPSQSLNSKNSDRITRRLNKEIQLQFAGIKGGQSTLVSNYIDKVIKVTELGGFEGSFLKMRQEIAKAICTLLQVPPEKIAINRSGSVYQSALVQDAINSDFDKAIAGRMDIVDEFINELIETELGITDVKIRANGRYGSLTINGARAGLIASQIGGLFTGDEMRQIFFGAPAMDADDPRKWEVADNSKNRDPQSIPPRFLKGKGYTLPPAPVLPQNPGEPGQGQSGKPNDNPEEGDSSPPAAPAKKPSQPKKPASGGTAAKPKPRR